MVHEAEVVVVWSKISSDYGVVVVWLHRSDSLGGGAARSEVRESLSRAFLSSDTSRCEPRS